MQITILWAFLAVRAIAAKETVSRTGRCGRNYSGLTCKGSSFGNCCSQYDWCGTTDGHCLVSQGCQSDFGTCSSVNRPSTMLTSTRSVPLAAPSSTNKVSTNARCGYLNGATNGMTCLGSKYGDCCSQYSYCGSTDAYCGAKCQAGFGQCNSLSSSIVSSTLALTSSISSRMSTASKASPTSSTISLTSTATSSASSNGLATSSGSSVSSSALSIHPSSSSISPRSTVSSAITSRLSLSASTSSSFMTSSTPSAIESPSISSGPASLVSSSASSSAPSSSAPSSSASSSPSPSVLFSASSATSFSMAILPTPSESPSASTDIPTLSSTIVPASSSPAAPCVTNLFVNPSFESGLSPWTTDAGGWTFVVQTSNGHSSNNYLAGVSRYTGNTGFQTIQTITLKEDTLVQASVYARAMSPSTTTGGAYTFSWYLDGRGFGTVQSRPLTVSAGQGWILIQSLPAIITAGTHTFQLQTMKQSGPVDMELGVDDFSLIPANNGVCF